MIRNNGLTLIFNDEDVSSLSVEEILNGTDVFSLVLPRPGVFCVSFIYYQTDTDRYSLRKVNVMLYATGSLFWVFLRMIW